MSNEKNAGRPKKKVDWDRARELAGLQATEKEIAADQGMHVSTFIRHLKDETEYNNFTEWFEVKRQPGLNSLRAKQFKKAVEQDNTTMQIWLGKNWLNQTDKQKQTIEEENPTEIIYKVAEPDEEND